MPLNRAAEMPARRRQEVLVSEERLSERLWWRPFPPGDPGPEIWRIIEELDSQRLIELVGVVLETQIAMSEAHLAGMQKIRDMVGSLSKK
jgi:hypothetical protein